MAANKDFSSLISLIKDLYPGRETIPLHEPVFQGNEKQYLLDTIDSTFVSSVGENVNRFEQMLCEYTGSKFAIATVNGTAALHVALLLAGVSSGDEVITQSLTFVATSNAIRYCGAAPVFLDVDLKTMGLSADSLSSFLHKFCEVRDDGFCWNKKTETIIRACVPMHTFGFPVEIDRIKKLCDEYHLKLVEDAAEALGSFYKGKHCGRFGDLAALSFNGNKIITTGGGGAILTDDESLARKAKHITTTAKAPHAWDFYHDEVGFNYRLPNINAALGIAQMEVLDEILSKKRELAAIYQEWGSANDAEFAEEMQDSRANYWLNVLISEGREQRDFLLESANKQGVLCRPAWIPMHLLEINKVFFADGMSSTMKLFNKAINLPSSSVF